jgi:hypothetical protein
MRELIEMVTSSGRKVSAAARGVKMEVATPSLAPHRL